MDIHPVNNLNFKGIYREQSNFYSPQQIQTMNKIESVLRLPNIGKDTLEKTLEKQGLDVVLSNSKYNNSIEVSVIKRNSRYANLFNFNGKYVIGDFNKDTTHNVEKMIEFRLNDKKRNNQIMQNIVIALLCTMITLLSFSKCKSCMKNNLIDTKLNNKELPTQNFKTKTTHDIINL